MGFCAFHLLLGAVVMVNLVVLVGTYFCSTWVVLGVLVPYYTYALVVNPCHLKTGARWTNFSQDFALLRYGRRLLNLRVVGNPALKATRSRSQTEAQLHTDAANPQPSHGRPGTQFILGVFPHGLNADFRILVDGLLPDAMPGASVRTLAATILFCLPVVREMALWTGCVDASKQVARRCLRYGLSLFIFPGGQQEQLRTTCGEELVFVQRRKGFVKLALEFGVPLVPAYVFGASDLYRTSHWALWTRLSILKYLGISITLGTGCYGSWCCPLPVDTTMVLGEPIPVSQVDEPSADQVDRVHAQFVAALQQLFDKHKEEMGYGDRTLEII